MVGIVIIPQNGLEHRFRICLASKLRDVAQDFQGCTCKLLPRWAPKKDDVFVPHHVP